MRASTFCLALIAAIAPAFMDTPKKLPSAALGSEFHIYVERGFALFVIQLFVFVVVARGWKGELPTALSQRGAEWADAVGKTARVLEAQINELRERVKALERDLGDLSDAVLELKR